MKKEDGNGNLSFLRRHYPDQVCGYFLSEPAIDLIVAGSTPV
jgi:hypothetical protein